MAGLSTGVKKLLTLSPCKVDDAGNISVDKSKKAFEVMINPSGYNHGFTIKSNKKEPLGNAGSDARFSGVRPETVGFDIVIDGTGVVDPGDSPDVKIQVQELKDVVYTYDGTTHAPNHVRLLWGSLIFFGTLDSMSVEYTLFKPSGEPLRAKVKLTFSGFVSKEEESLRASRSSPDLDHIIEVKSGDTLPLLCYRVYQDSTYYAEVAKVNNILNFRDLSPGDRLHFPPLR